MLESKEKIRNNLKEAMLSKQQELVSVLRMLWAAIVNREKEKRAKIAKQNTGLTPQELDKESELTDEETMDVLVLEAKKRKESIVEFEKGQRQDLAEKEKRELEILQKYLPEQLSEEEVKNLVKEAIEKVGAKELKD